MQQSLDTIKNYIYVAAGVVLLMLLGYLYYLNDRLEITKAKLELANENISSLNHYIDKTNQQLKAIQQLDKDYQEKLTHAQTENDKLPDSIANGTKLTPSEQESDQLLKAIKAIITANIPTSLSDWKDIDNKPLAIDALTNITTVNTTSTLTNEQLGLVLIDASANAVTLTLPLVVEANKSAKVYLLRLDNSNYEVNVKASTGQSINFDTSLALASSGSLLGLVSSGSTWYSLTPHATEKKRGLVQIASDEVFEGKTDTEQAITTAQFYRGFETLSKLKYTVIYPQGTEESPFTLAGNTRISVDNPFGDNDTIFCELQIKYNNDWANPGDFLFSGGTGSNSVGAKAVYVTTTNKIIVQTGSGGVCYRRSVLTGSPFGENVDTSIASAPFRIRVWRV